jgi:arachidonate 15-lipoxygenase
MGFLPLLPQNDPQIAEREAELHQQQAKYQYNYTYVAPLPMVQSLPSAEQPSLRWLLRVLDASVKLVLNSLQVKHKDSLLDKIENLASYVKFTKLLRKNNPQEVEKGLADILNTIQAVQVEGPGNSWQEYQEIFQAIPLPAISKVFTEDAEFAWLRDLIP